MRRSAFDHKWLEHQKRRAGLRANGKLSQKELDQRAKAKAKAAARPRRKRKAPWQWLQSLADANKRRSAKAAERLRLQQEWSAKLAMDGLVERVRVLLEGEVRGAVVPRPGMAVGAGPSVRAARGARRPLPARFAAALANDLDTPAAIRELRAAVRRRDRASVSQMLPILVGTASLS